MLSEQLVIFFLSILPISELKLTIPLGISVYNLPILETFFFAVLGNIVPPIFLLLFFKRIKPVLLNYYLFKNFFQWYFKQIKKTKEKTVTKYGEYLGLIILTAIPLPFTGVWTASLVAFFLDIPFRKSYVLIVIGVLISGIIITLSTIGVLKIFNF